MPQSVWWIRMISLVPSSRWLMASERISSSVTTPPALRMTCASPVVEAEDPVDVEPGVHARHHGDVLARRQRQRAREARSRTPRCSSGTRRSRTWDSLLGGRDVFRAAGGRSGPPSTHFGHTFGNRVQITLEQIGVHVQRHGRAGVPEHPLQFRNLGVRIHAVLTRLAPPPIAPHRMHVARTCLLGQRRARWGSPRPAARVSTCTQRLVVPAFGHDIACGCRPARARVYKSGARDCHRPS